MRFLITAGPTREPIDPVRYLSNRSSGKMGYAIAEAAIEAGHEVVLISGPVQLGRPRAVALVPVSTSDQMFEAVQRQVRNCDILVMCAAVADYKPVAVFTKKIKKRDAKLSLELIPTRDILSSLPKNRKYLVVGFAAETEDLAANAQKKLLKKNCDMIVANDARIGMESDENEVEIFVRGGETKKISRAPKKIIARELVKSFENVCEKRLTKKTQ
ncbi:MAG TPA: phosphopantothenoylcysteine decarboxylase [Chthoniobacterales bacterium]|nr:phosphopantothenoylcysteine decarboxylase [Chthoniobacterales bacterium]